MLDYRAPACLLLAGCSAVRLAYNQAPDLMYWWLNGYVDFDAEAGRARTRRPGRLVCLASCHATVRLRGLAGHRRSGRS